MAKWNFVAMGQAGLTGWTGKAARPVARAPPHHGDDGADRVDGGASKPKIAERA